MTELVDTETQRIIEKCYEQALATLPGSRDRLDQLARTPPGGRRRQGPAGDCGRAAAGVTAGGPRPGTHRIAGPVAGACQQLEERADTVSVLSGVPERAVGVDGVDRAPAGPGASEPAYSHQK